MGRAAASRTECELLGSIFPLNGEKASWKQFTEVASDKRQGTEEGKLMQFRFFYLGNQKIEDVHLQRRQTEKK